MLSLWQSQSFFTSTDVLIIGAGITGLSISIALKKQHPGLTVRIVEAGAYPSGASVKNAGFACFGSLSELLDDLEKEGEEQAMARIEKRYRGIQKLLRIVHPQKVDFRQDGGFEIFSQHEAEIYGRCKQELTAKNEALQRRLGFAPYEWVSNSFGFNTDFPLLKIHGEGVLHSGKLIQALMNAARKLGVLITGGYEVKNYDKTGSGWSITNGDHPLKAARLIVATNGLSTHLLPDEDIVPTRGQILLTKPIPGFSLQGSFHAHQGYYYFREIENRLMIGGARHIDRENEYTDAQTTSPKIQQALEDFARHTVVPHQDVEVDQRWAGTMAFGRANLKMPLIKYDKSGVIVAARLGGMGVAMATMVADDVVKLLEGGR